MRFRRAPPPVREIKSIEDNFGIRLFSLSLSDGREAALSSSAYLRFRSCPFFLRPRPFAKNLRLTKSVSDATATAQARSSRMPPVHVPPVVSKESRSFGTRDSFMHGAKELVDRVSIFLFFPPQNEYKLFFDKRARETWRACDSSFEFQFRRGNFSLYRMSLRKGTWIIQSCTDTSLYKITQKWKFRARVQFLFLLNAIINEWKL